MLRLILITNLIKSLILINIPIKLINVLIINSIIFYFFIEIKK